MTKTKGLYRDATILRTYRSNVRQFLRSQPKYIKVNRIFDDFMAAYPGFCKDGGYTVQKHHFANLIRKNCIPYRVTTKGWITVYENPFHCHNGSDLGGDICNP